MAAFFDKTRARAMSFEAGEAIMWRLVQRYTGQVGYQRGVKSEGLSATPPVIDCSGWTALLLTQAMQAENEAAGRDVFGADDMLALQVWSDRIIHEVEIRTHFILQGHEITHIVQVVRRPEDDAPFVSEAFGGSPLPGISLTPLTEWLAVAQPRIRAGEMWAVDPFRMAARRAD